MTRRAWAFIWGVFLAGALLSGSAILISPGVSSSQALTFGVLLLLTILTQFLEALAPGRSAYYPHLVFLFAGVLLLPPLLFALLVTIPHLVEWVRKRLANSPTLRNWYIQPFNIATHLIAGILARWAITALVPAAASLITPVSLLAVTCGVLIYVFLNHLLVGLALVLARGISLRESGVFEIANLLSDTVQLCLGYVAAVLWQLNPWLILPALSPLVMIYRALMVPQLEKEANTDAKTSLWNTRHFNQLFAAEMERAWRFNRPLSVIMADLDLLRNVNNTYGHLAGDVVLTGIGQLIRRTVREYDIPSRFGGEEFCIVLLEAGQAEAQAFAERLRRAVEATAFQVLTSRKPIHVTMSLGIACFPQDGITTTELTHKADMAVYQAKLRGRNCVVCAADVPHSVKLEGMPVEGSPAMTYAAAFVRRETLDTSASPAAEAPAPPPENKEQASPVASEQNFPKALLPWFVGWVIATGAALTSLGLWQNPRPDLAVIVLLTALAVLAELFQVSVYGDNTVSVSVAIAFAAALITGLPGVAAVSAGIALTHYAQKRPALYKTAFNWATHVLAGAVPALMIQTSSASLQVSNLLVLGILTVIIGLIYYGIDTGLIAIAISLAQGSGLKATWQEQFRWLFAHYLVLCVIGLVLAIAYRALGLPGVIVFSLPVFLTRYAQKQYVEHTEESVRELRRMNQELKLANREIAGASQSIRQFNDELFLTLSKVIDARDPDAAGHATKVADYATAIAVEMGLPVERVEHIRQAALLHDIGKLGITERILHKPSRLDAEEYAIIKTHAALGAEFLETCQGLRHLATHIKHHHEQWDGAGYPDGLRGEQIPMEARILAVCDAVDAMASDRPYQKAISLDEIMAELERCVGTQFDPAVVQAFVCIAERRRESVANSTQAVVRQPAALPEERNGRSGWLVSLQVQDRAAAAA